jgi:hypothetical protein
MGARPQHTLAYRRFCTLLRGWRDRAGLTQRALAKLLNKPHSYVHKAEVGDRRVDPLEFIAWCEACGIEAVDGVREIRATALGLRRR